MHSLENNNYLYGEQYRFRENRSTENAILVALDHVRRIKSKGHYPVLVSLDIKAAFDTIQWNTIRDAMNVAPMDKGLLPLVNSYLSNRTVVFSDKNKLVRFRVDRGWGRCSGL